MRSFAVLIVSTGLLFGAAAPALSNDAATNFPSPEGTESPPPSVTATEDAEEYLDSTETTAPSEIEEGEDPEDTSDLPGSPSGTASVTPAPSPDETSPAPTPTEDPVEEPSSSPTDPETEDPSPSPTDEETEDPTSSPTDGATEDPPPTDSETPDPSVTCRNRSLHPGETLTVSCTTIPDGMPIELGSHSSSIGGSIALNGTELTYTAPTELHSTRGDQFTVKIQDHGAATQVTFTVLGDNGQSPSPTQTSQPPSDPGTTPAPTSSAPGQTETTSAPDVPAPGVPSEPSSIELEDHVFLPAPGMPKLNELMIPWVIGGSNIAPSPEPTASSDPESSSGSGDNGELAQTGTVAVYGATGIALVTMLMGTGAMAVSRRIR